MFGATDQPGLGSAPVGWRPRLDTKQIAPRGAVNSDTRCYCGEKEARGTPGSGRVEELNKDKKCGQGGGVSVEMFKIKKRVEGPDHHPRPQSSLLQICSEGARKMVKLEEQCDSAIHVQVGSPDPLRLGCCWSVSGDPFVKQEKHWVHLPVID